jgi:invasion protein IalB
MRLFHCLTPFALVLAALAVPLVAGAKSPTHAKAIVKRAATPESIGKFGDWEAATHRDAGTTECYAFTRPISSAPALPGRGDVFFTITERAKLRDTVALSAGFAYPANAVVTVKVGDQAVDFYSSGRSAFAHDGAALIAAFAKGDVATVISPAPKGKIVTDLFSLTGFVAAMKAVMAACPVQ